MDVDSMIEDVKKALPRYKDDEDICLKVADKLLHLGVKSRDDLKFVAYTDFADILDPIPARALVAFWQNQKDNSQQVERQPQVQQVAAVAPNAREWTFEINWQDIFNIRKELKSRMRRGKKLCAKDKREIVSRLVKQVRDRVPNVTRKTFLQVGKDLKRKYPVTFSSEMANGVLIKKTLAKRMADKFDNDRRPKNKTRMETEAPGIKAAYGCVKWRLMSNPPGETDESIEAARTELVQHYEQVRPEHWNKDLIAANMSKTYRLQRKEINEQAEIIEKQIKKNRAKKKKQKQGVEDAVQEEENEDSNLIITTAEIRNRWPFLFTTPGMLQHFKTLTGIDFEEKLGTFFTKGIEDVMRFLIETNKTSTKKVKKQLAKRTELEDENEKHKIEVAALMKLLTDRFKEDMDGLAILVHRSFREREIEKECKIPKTPRLIIAGKNFFQVDAIYFTMDGSIVGVCTDIANGLALLFASYFVFNLNYEATAQVTLEFIQRCIAYINPSKGNKRPNRAQTVAEGGIPSSRKVHHCLSRLNENFENFFADQDATSSEEDEMDES